MPATKRGIFHNLSESKYTASNGEVVFFFSSEYYLTKFLDGYQQHRTLIASRLDKVLADPPYNTDMLADLTYYETVEKRGFFSRMKGVELTCQDLHLYALRRMTEKNTLNWQNGQRLNLAERKGISKLT